jgi:hypothetical protein
MVTDLSPGRLALLTQPCTGRRGMVQVETVRSVVTFRMELLNKTQIDYVSAKMFVVYQADR